MFKEAKTKPRPTLYKTWVKSMNIVISTRQNICFQQYSLMSIYFLISPLHYFFGPQSFRDLSNEVEAKNKALAPHLTSVTVLVCPLSVAMWFNDFEVKILHELAGKQSSAPDVISSGC